MALTLLPPRRLPTFVSVLTSSACSGTSTRLPEQLRQAVHTMLDGIAAHYRRRDLEQPDVTLLKCIDGVIAIAVEDPATLNRDLLLQLGGIRRGMFPDAAPYMRDAALIGQQAV